MVHAGFRLPKNQMAYDAMSPGWGSVVKRIGAVFDEASSGRSSGA
jgi:hypothetical protein